MKKEKLVLTKTPVWERQTGETSGQYMWFTRYMEARLNGDSLTAVCKKYDKKESYARVLRNWSYLNHWVSRIEAYRDFLELERQRQRLNDIREMGERQARSGVLMQQYALAWFTAHPDTGQGGLTPELALKFMETGAKIERTARGAPTEIRAEAELPEETRRRMESIYEESLAAAGDTEPEVFLEQNDDEDDGLEETETFRG